MTDGEHTSWDEVLLVCQTLDGIACRYWVAGGWGVDLLAGRHTRPHRDLDLALDALGLDGAMRALARRGYRVETDWLPVRVELHRPGHGWVDLHPVRFAESGDGTQAGFDGVEFHYPRDDLVSGRLNGVRIDCVSKRLQLEYHSGYEPRPVDLLDVAVLRSLA